MAPASQASIPRVFSTADGAGDYELRVAPDSTVFFEDSRPGQATDTIAVCLPGIGDTRRQFRSLAPLLHDRLGFRVLVGDLRGFGDSTPFTTKPTSPNYPLFSPESVAADMAQLLRELHAAHPSSSFVLLGNSLAAGSAVLVANELAGSGINIKALVFLGPILRDTAAAAVFKFVSPLLLNPLWGVWFWLTYYKTLFPIQGAPADLDAEIPILESHLRSNKDGVHNTRQFIIASKHAVEAAVETFGKEQSALPVVAFLGGKDPDYSNVDAEKTWLTGALPHANVFVDANGGHYPHLESPVKVANALASALGLGPIE